jgi:hypothetical protein
MKFVEEHKEEITPLSTQEVVTKIVIPATRERKSRYVDLLPPEDVSLPTYFASHVWSAPFLDLVYALKYYIDGMHENTAGVFVWIDIFAVNQHRDSGTQAADLSEWTSYCT